MQEYTLRQWIEAFDKGEFNFPDIKTQCKAGWYDWFCTDKSLRNRLYRLAPKVKQIAKSSKINLDTTYVFLKNNCPVYGKLYDDFRICDLTKEEVLFTIVPRTGFEKHDARGKSEVWGRENGFKEPLVVGTWRDVTKFFGVK